MGAQADDAIVLRARTAPAIAVTRRQINGAVRCDEDVAQATKGPVKEPLLRYDAAAV